MRDDDDGIERGSVMRKKFYQIGAAAAAVAGSIYGYEWRGYGGAILAAIVAGILGIACVGFLIRLIAKSGLIIWGLKFVLTAIGILFVVSAIVALWDVQ